MTARRTTVFMKFLMAVSGLIFVFYVLVHMYGNLKIFGGNAAFDEYALHLRTLFMPILPFGGFLWLFRILLVDSDATRLSSTDPSLPFPFGPSWARESAELDRWSPITHRRPRGTVMSKVCSGLV